MTVFQIIALLLTSAAAGAYINKNLFKLPSTIGLMLFALLISMAAICLNRVHWINLNAASDFVEHIDFSAILLHGMLSFLLFAGALHVNLADLKKHQVIVATLATVGVLVATLITGTGVWWAAQLFHTPLTFIYAMLFGALISPTDPVAVMGILKETGMSKNLRVKIGCESLLNDGVGVVAFLLLLTMALSPNLQISSADIILLLTWEGAGSIVLGLTLGWLVFKLLNKTDDYKVEVLLTLALVSGGYSLAEIVHVSAPITMVVAGLVIGNHGRKYGMSERSRQHLDMFWELLDEILNAVLFMLIGLEMMVVTFSSLYLAMGLAAIIAMLVGRFISVALPVSFMGLRYRFERGTIPLLIWGGLRGGISIAMALSLPSGPEKDMILSMTYMTVVFSILFQGTTFKHVARLIVEK